MIVLVTGGREFRDRHSLNAALSSLDPRPSLIVHCGERGADSLAHEWAQDHSVPVKVFHADWKRYGRMAGHVRNRLMLNTAKPDLVVAFPGGRGTAGMVKLAEQAGVRVLRGGLGGQLPTG